MRASVDLVFILMDVLCEGSMEGTIRGLFDHVTCQFNRRYRFGMIEDECNTFVIVHGFAKMQYLSRVSMVGIVKASLFALNKKAV